MATKSSIQHILTPETEKRFFTDQILPPLLRGESVSIVWLPHGGGIRQMVFLAQYADVLGFGQLGNYKIVYVNLDELTENSPESYFKLMVYKLDGSKVDESEAITAYICLKEKCKKALKEFDRIIFVLEGFSRMDYPPSFFNNLFNLWQSEKNKTHFIFPITKSFFANKEIQRFGRLGELLIQNIIYSPLFSEKDSLFSADYLINQYSYKVSEKQKKMIAAFCGGHPGLAKTCLRLMSGSKEGSEKETFDFLLNQWETKIVIEDIWEAFINEERDVLWQIATGGSPAENQISDYLKNLKVVQFVNSSWQLFSPIFQNYVRNQKEGKRILSISEQTGELLVNNSPSKEIVTLNEYRLLMAFLKSESQTITRDQIAEILWGKDSYQKYSDWAIDQTISLLRKKLERIGVSSGSIQTVKGRGYRWLS
jgi:hypothetical protein